MPRSPFTPFDESVYRPIIHSVPLKGVAPDKPVEELGNEYLVSARNFLVRNGRVVKREGYSNYYPADPSSMTNVIMGGMEFISTRAPASATLVVSTTTAFFINQPDPISTGWAAVTGPSAQSGTGSNPVFFCSIMTASNGQQIIGTNGVNYPSQWAGTTTANFAILSTSVIGACIIPWKNHLLLGDTTDTGDGAIITRVHWSALGDPTVWFGTASAGSIDLTESNASRVLNMVPMRNFIAVYKEQGVHAMSYRASPLWFTQSVLHPTLSAISRRAMTPIHAGEQHFVLTKDGAVLWDGQTVVPIGRDRVDRTILGQLNWAAREVVWAQWWSANEEVILAIPTGTAVAPNALWIYSLTHDAWWEQKFPAGSRFGMPAFFQGSAPMFLQTFEAGFMYDSF
jgi:hypothetical protein